MLSLVCAASAFHVAPPAHSALARSVRPRMEAAVAEPEVEEVPWKGAEAWSEGMKDPDTVFDIAKVKEVLPHRYPFLLVDKIVEFLPGKKAVGIKKVTVNEEFFNGHFPARPIMPGVLQVEAMAQVGGMVCLQEPITDPTAKGDFFFAGVNNIKWRRPVVPGDTLVMEMELTAFKPRFGLVKMKGALRRHASGPCGSRRRRASHRPLATAPSLPHCCFVLLVLLVLPLGRCVRATPRRTHQPHATWAVARCRRLDLCRREAGAVG
jgi:3-hydroxyacyl-[acyl-carrier-protein] dehydratase